MSPFKALYGYNPRMIEYVSSRYAKSMGVIERLEHIRQLCERLQQSWEEAVERQAKYYNARHTAREYKKGQIVGLSTQNFRFKTGSKIAPRFIPVKIAERVGNQAYKVILPTKYA